MMKLKQNELMLTLIESGNIESACKEAGISRNTYSGLLKNRVFIEKSGFL